MLYKELGTIKRENNLRVVWKSEPKDFTPWVEKNINKVGEVIGLDLEVIQCEKKIKSIYADILAKDKYTDEKVIIENQLEQSDSDHLGRLLAYAAGVDAKKIIWIVSKVKEEFGAAIKWLNDISLIDIEFYILEIQLWKIDNSRLAPVFNIIEKPNKLIETIKQDNISRTDIQNYTIWSEFNNYISDNKNSFFDIFNKKDPSYRSYYELRPGFNNTVISLIVSRRSGGLKIGVEYYLEDAKDIYNILYSHKDKIEKKLNTNVEWIESTGKIRNVVSKITATKSVKDLSNPDLYPEYFDWYVEKALIFKKLINKFIKESKK